MPTRALVHPTTFIVDNIISVSPSQKTWTTNGTTYWCCPIATGQVVSIGYIYTPINSPITLSNVFDGGTYSPPAPSWPPIEESIQNGIASTNTLSDQKILALTPPTEAVTNSILYSQLSTKISNNTATSEEIAIFASIDAVYIQAQAIKSARDNIITYLLNLTDPQAAAEFDAENPPQGLSWPN